MSVHYIYKYHNIKSKLSPIYEIVHFKKTTSLNYRTQKTGNILNCSGACFFFYRKAQHLQQTPTFNLIQPATLLHKLTNS